MKVSLIAHTPNPERVVSASAKLCYSAVGVEALEATMSEEQSRVFLDKLSDLGHFSPYEHATFTFAIEGVSRVLTHQLVRHRMASYSQQSQRYVKLEAFEYVVPPEIKANEKAFELFEKAMKEDQETYNALVALLEPQYYEAYLNKGYSEKKAQNAAEKAAIEDARFVFPNACETKIVVTMNARSLIHFFNHRCCNRAQWEIRDLANAMRHCLKGVAPTLFKHAGPLCITGPCPEGIMTCGEIASVRAYYSD